MSENNRPTLTAAGIMEHLVCPICSNVLNETVSVWPCLHSFCGGCLSKWIYEYSNPTCPECRGEIDPYLNVRKDRTKRQLVQALLSVNPELQARTKVELRTNGRENRFKWSLRNNVVQPVADVLKVLWAVFVLSTTSRIRRFLSNIPAGELLEALGDAADGWQVVLLAAVIIFLMFYLFIFAINTQLAHPETSMVGNYLAGVFCKERVDID